LYPRNYNLRWIDKGTPWSLAFQVVSGSSSPQLGDGAMGRNTISSFSPDNGKAELDFSIEDGIATLLFYLLGK